MLFMLSFEDNPHRTRPAGCFLLKVEIKHYNVINDGQNFFEQPLKNDLRTYNIRKITIGQEDDYTTGSLLDYTYFKEKLIAIDLSKQQALDADAKAMHQN